MEYNGKIREAWFEVSDRHEVRFVNGKGYVPYFLDSRSVMPGRRLENSGMTLITASDYIKLLKIKMA